MKQIATVHETPYGLYHDEAEVGDIVAYEYKSKPALFYVTSTHSYEHEFRRHDGLVTANLIKQDGTLSTEQISIEYRAGSTEVKHERGSLHPRFHNKEVDLYTVYPYCFGVFGSKREAQAAEKFLDTIGIDHRTVEHTGRSGLMPKYYVHVRAGEHDTYPELDWNKEER